MADKKIKVLFAGAEHRMRRKETMLHPPDDVEFIPAKPLEEMRKDWELTNVKGENSIAKNWRVFSRVFKYNNLIQKDLLNGIDLVYSPGYAIFNRFPFVVEIDNVSVLAYYKLGLLKVLKPLIKRILKSKWCRHIICISEASRMGLINYFDDNLIASKSSVVYPYVDRPKITKRVSKTARFLFISSNFYLKGGKEVAKAFFELEKKHPDIHLTIITKLNEIDPDLRLTLERNKKVTLLEANIDKSVLFEKYYSNADVFVLPTYQDSFGLVFLEALAAGLPIITTRMAATSEMVENGKNGFLCESPIPYFTKEFLPNPAWWEVDKALYAKTRDFPQIEKFLKEKMEEFIKNPKLKESMSKESLRIVNNRFSEEKRLLTLGTILHKSVEGVYVRN